MALTYKGNCEWEPAGDREARTPPNDLPITQEPWMGRSDKTAAFLAQYAVGKQYLGGYIIENTPKSNYPFPGVDWVDLQIAMPPKFDVVLSHPGRSIKTAQKSATVQSSGVIDGESEVTCVKEITYYAPEIRYEYFASKRPAGARYTDAAGIGSPEIIRSVIRVTGKTTGKEITYTNSTAPAAVVTAMIMGETNLVSGHEARQIPGTPWYSCTDVVSREFAGD